MSSNVYYRSIDEKHRVRIPSSLRLSFQGNIVIVRGMEGCLFVFSEEKWNDIISKLDGFSRTADNRKFVRTFLASASEVKMDSEGRITIPKSLVPFFKDECLLIKKDDRLELWSKEVINKKGVLEETDLEIGDGGKTR